MSRLGTMAMTLGVLALLAGRSSAQGPGVPNAPFGGGGWFLVTNESVRSELKVTPAQAGELDTLAESARTLFRATLLHRQQLPEGERREETDKVLGNSDADLHAGLEGVLKPEQVRRFDQIALQAAGIEAFSTDRVRSAIKLTPAQEKQGREISSEAQRELQALQLEVGDDREAALGRIAAVRRRSVDRVVGLLTAQQKATWKDLTGEAFEVKMEAPRPLR